MSEDELNNNLVSFVLEQNNGNTGNIPNESNSSMSSGPHPINIFSNQDILAGQTMLNSLGPISNNGKFDSLKCVAPLNVPVPLVSQRLEALKHSAPLTIPVPLSNRDFLKPFGLGQSLEEMFKDHDLQESTNTLESSLEIVNTDDGDDSGSVLSGIFDDEDGAAAPSKGPMPSPSDCVDDRKFNNEERFKPFHEEKWNTRLKEILKYREEHGHCLVPHTYTPNPQLARWVKRQRRQYKLMLDGKASTMTQDRLDILNNINFIWDSHEAAWQEKLNDLNRFRNEHGNCLVPSNYKHNPQLATWVKCQRRQYKLFWEGRPSAMTSERILQLERVGFEWEIRSSNTSGVAGSDFLRLTKAIAKMA